jgi:hypothetical protein
MLLLRTEQVPEELMSSIRLINLGGYGALATKTEGKSISALETDNDFNATLFRHRQSMARRRHTKR